MKADIHTFCFAGNENEERNIFMWKENGVFCLTSKKECIRLEALDGAPPKRTESGFFPSSATLFDGLLNVFYLI